MEIPLRIPRSNRSRAAAPAGFDFTRHMRRVCADMAGRLPELAHIDPDRVAISYSQARTRARHGLQATLTPMRFAEGSLTGLRRGRRYTVQRLFDASGRETLYILSFYLPRFADLEFGEKILTTLHELWHIGAKFDGDLRRHAGRCYAHTHSQKRYDETVRQLADRYLETAPCQELIALLRLSFRELQERHGGVYGTRIPHPKLIPIE